MKVQHTYHPHHFSWHFVVVAIIVGFVVFIECWPHVSDNTLMGSALVTGGLCIGSIRMAHHHDKDQEKQK
ncbi:hypothetical protein [Lacticaseibacillus paracasei]|uniref:hypothetical protein n=1 Tax=Lacticaseibacillus paracasei TaxID=1597 RepID=UPI0021D3919F|nr:hypothetical protein [Lacticaseibacillus paracasei]MCU6430222.1 hypothetical protein [Lacticaseibacillus paracasei]